MDISEVMNLSYIQKKKDLIFKQKSDYLKYQNIQKYLIFSLY